MKKLSSLIIIGALTLSIFAGCSSKDNDMDKDDGIKPPKADENINGGDTGGNMLGDGDDMLDMKDENVYVDGTYRAESKDYIDGYKDYVEIVITDGRIADATYNGINENSELKTEDKVFADKFYDEFKIYPADFMKTYPEKLVEYQDINKVEEIVGAETEHQNFKKLVKEVLENAKTGDTETKTVEY